MRSSRFTVTSRRVLCPPVFGPGSGPVGGFVVELSPGSGVVVVEVSPGSGAVEVDVSPDGGVVVEVPPGSGAVVEVSPGVEGDPSAGIEVAVPPDASVEGDPGVVVAISGACAADGPPNSEAEQLARTAAAMASPAALAVRDAVRERGIRERFMTTALHGVNYQK